MNCATLSLLAMSNAFATPWTVARQALFCLLNSPGKSIGVGFHFLLQGIIPTQKSNLGLLFLLHFCMQILYQLVTWEVF